MPDNMIDSVQAIAIPAFPREDGELFVMDQNAGLPIKITRTFVVKGRKAGVRGQHAHQQCAQLFICLHGACTVTSDDGRETHRVTLCSAETGLLVPPGIWSTQTYLEDDTILLVLCDRPYEEDDYIRNRDAFLRFRGISEAS